MFMVPIFFFTFMFLVFGLGVIGTTQTQLQTKIDEINCGMPLFQGFPPPANFTYNYLKQSPANNTLLLSCTTVHTPFGYDYNYGQPFVSLGIFFYAFDYISEVVHKLTAVIQIMFFIVTPPSNLDNFAVGNVLVSTIMMFVYVIMYVMFGVGIYKMINPLSGS